MKKQLEAWPWKGGTRPNPPRAIALVPRWTWLQRGGVWNADVRRQVRGQTGVYAIRDRRTKTVLYVGESHAFPVNDPARMWKTITRHFQDPTGKFEKMSEWTHRKPGACQVSVWTMPPGEPERALHLEARAQRRFKPTGIIKEPAPF